MDARTTAGGRTLYVDRREAERGSKAPFLAAYENRGAGDRDEDARWGYFCTNCETFDNAMDAMGRIKCNRCANIRKPEEWDAAHE